MRTSADFHASFAFPMLQLRPSMHPDTRVESPSSPRNEVVSTPTIGSSTTAAPRAPRVTIEDIVSISASPGARIFEKASTAMTSCHPIIVMSRRRRGESGWKCSVPIASFRFEIHGLDGCSPRHELPCLVSLDYRLRPVAVLTTLQTRLATSASWMLSDNVLALGPKPVVCLD